MVIKQTVWFCFVRFSNINWQNEIQDEIKFCLFRQWFRPKSPSSLFELHHSPKQFNVMATACWPHWREVNHLASSSLPPPASCVSVAERRGALSCPANRASDTAAGCHTNIRLWQSHTHTHTLLLLPLCTSTHMLTHKHYAHIYSNTLLFTHTLVNKSARQHKQLPCT